VAERILLIVYGLYSTGAVLGGRDAVPSAIALAEQTIRAARPSAHAASALTGTAEAAAFAPEPSPGHADTVPQPR
jgi:hypothetical protein